MALGWNYHAWNAALAQSKVIKKMYRRKDLRVLEVGASEHSCVSLLFKEISREITVWYWDPKSEKLIYNKIKRMNLEHRCKKN